MDYHLHDVSRFPLVALRSSACVPGFGAAWGREMDALLDAGKPFVVAFEPAAIVELQEDFRTRAQWFKANRLSLSGRCAAMVAIIPSAPDRDAITEDLAKRSRGFGVPYLAMESFAVAEKSAGALVSRIGRRQ